MLRNPSNIKMSVNVLQLIISHRLPYDINS